MIPDVEERRRARERARLWYERNAERHRETARQWLARNRERHRENARRWYERNAEQQRKKTRIWRAEPTNLERHKENTRRWLKTPKGRAAKRQRDEIRRAIKRKAKIGSIPRDAEEQLLAFQGGRCAYCHEILMDYHVDHVVPLARGGAHTWENLVLACPPCNWSKNDRLVEEWVR